MGLKSFVKRKVYFARIWARKQRFFFKNSIAQPGEVEWLIETEAKYGGYIRGLQRKVISDHHDSRGRAKLFRRFLQGGDRMLYHGYGKKYAEYLAPFVSGCLSRTVTLIELGILRGTGLAIWCDLFKNGRIVGLDIDLEYFNANVGNLRRLGAFIHNYPELYHFDQYKNNREYLRNILGNDRIDIFIDDGIHDSEAIMNTMKCVVPYLSDQFVYFVEDNKDVHSQIRQNYPDFTVASYGRLTVITGNSN